MSETVIAPPDAAPGPFAVPAVAGIGLRSQHVRDFLTAARPVGWLEVHSENYLADGGPRLAALERIRRDYPVSCHGVGLSLGSADGVSREHLDRLKRLFDRIDPAIVSEHVSWSAVAGVHLNDLLPLPRTREALDTVCRNIDQAQAVFGRRILVENPSTYLGFPEDEMPESEFLSAIVAATGCGLLLDVNNVFVSAHNAGKDPIDWLDAMPTHAIGEIHLAGHATIAAGGDTLLLDDHGSRVADTVWALYRRLIGRTGPVPTLIEWDTDVPPLAVLLAEAAKADALLTGRHRDDRGRTNRGGAEHAA